MFAENAPNFSGEKRTRAATLHLPLEAALRRSTSPLYAPLYFIYYAGLEAA